MAHFSRWCAWVLLSTSSKESAASRNSGDKMWWCIVPEKVAPMVTLANGHVMFSWSPCWPWLILGAMGRGSCTDQKKTGGSWEGCENAGNYQSLWLLSHILLIGNDVRLYTNQHPFISVNFVHIFCNQNIHLIIYNNCISGLEIRHCCLNNMVNMVFQHQWTKTVGMTKVSCLVLSSYSSSTK